MSYDKDVVGHQGDYFVLRSWVAFSSSSGHRFFLVATFLGNHCKSLTNRALSEYCIDIINIIRLCALHEFFVEGGGQINAAIKLLQCFLG